MSDSTRREALGLIATSAVLPVLGAAQATHAHGRRAAVSSVPYSPKYFNAQQLQTIEALAETVIPADQHSPGARAARVHEYIDTVIADANDSVKHLWKQGLEAINEMAGRVYHELNEEQKTALLGRISQNEDHPATLAEKFFSALKKTTVDGYYTSEIGIHQDLEYQGNGVLAEFQGCTHKEHQT